MAGTTSLAVIDVSGLNRGSANALPQVAAAIRAACMGQGFFYVSGHGVPEAGIDAAAAASRNFFRLPTEQKALVRANQRHRGWHAMGGALMEGAKNTDRKEFFSMGLELPEDDPSVLAGEALRGPNQWPEFAPALQPAMSAYYEAMMALGARLMRAVVVNVGDLLRRWSNGRFASTPHRVVRRSGRERMPIATFHDPDFGATIDPRELGTPEGEAHYEPITAGQHILNCFDWAFGYRKTLAAAG
jgi:isopenicillin N synthase-like dioxygenase